ncbi:adenosylcobinamide-phosphate synthase CbiB [Geotalea uraniireducens]|uniref:Cobalamin biosynthesis protein CobD n=1 Tax=Geotalea uraniireducens (strain Rf4) TaxID=351605 RepID=A5GDT3_GEOUR|nr:adenosylcobinamide-phosphate synthase CbiB [Geotalea uraniireducens]ABQ24260.1 adenosylcobinamide-phosphate synthase [Geotalea uraniireducens Rf4]
MVNAWLPVTETLARSAAVIIVAVLLDLLLGDPRWLPHPVVGIGRLISFTEKALRRSIPNERAAGILLLFITVGLTYSLAYLFLRGAYGISPYLGSATAAFLAWTCLAARSLHRESRLVADALLRGDIQEARRYLSYIVGRDTAELEAPEIWRGVVETVAENTSDGVIAPLFYLMLGGPALGLAYKAVNTLDSMVGYKNERYLRFGWASARFDDLANYIPARLTGLLMVIAAPLVGLSARSAWRIMLRDGRNHSSPNSGVSEAAAAGALAVQLGGLNHYFGKPVEKPTIGDACGPLTPEAYRGAVRLMYGAEILLVAGFLVVANLCFSP